MKASVEGLCSEVAARYIQYVETLLVDLWSEDGQIEFRCGFALRRDHELRSVTLKFPARLARTDDERKLVILAIFDEIEELIDESIAEQRVFGKLTSRPPSSDPTKERKRKRLERLLVELEAHLGKTDAERKLVILAIFEEIEQLVDEAIGEEKVSAN